LQGCANQWVNFSNFPDPPAPLSLIAHKNMYITQKIVVVSKVYVRGYFCIHNTVCVLIYTINVFNLDFLTVKDPDPIPASGSADLRLWLVRWFSKAYWIIILNIQIIPVNFGEYIIVNPCFYLSNLKKYQDIALFIFIQLLNSPSPLGFEILHLNCFLGSVLQPSLSIRGSCAYFFGGNNIYFKTNFFYRLCIQKGLHTNP
jgi:hypothetical protein